MTAAEPALPKQAKSGANRPSALFYVLLAAALLIFIQTFALLSPILLSLLLILLISLAVNPVVARMRAWTGGRKGRGGTAHADRGRGHGSDGLGIQALENNVVVPFVMAHGMNLHPLAVIFSMLLCVAAFGVLGVLVAAPLVAIVSILHEELYRTRFLPMVTDADLDRLSRKALREHVSANE